MKYLLASFLFACCVVLYGQEAEEENRKLRVGFGMNIYADFLVPEQAEIYGLSKVGMTWIDMNIRLNVLKYINIDGGFSVSNFKDKLPFTEAVTFTSGTLAGLPSEAESSIVSGSFYYAIGTMVPVTEKIGVIAAAGKRNYSATRKISLCSDCNRVELATAAGPYVQGGVALLQTEDKIDGQFHLLYTKYFSDDFDWSVGIGFVLLY